MMKRVVSGLSLVVVVALGDPAQAQWLPFSVPRTDSSNAAPASSHRPPVSTGLVSVDTYSTAKLESIIKAGYQPEIAWQDAYSQYIDVHTYVPGVSIEMAWDYVRDIRHAEEWAVGVRNIRQLPDQNGMPLWVADELMLPGAQDYMSTVEHPAEHVMDWWVGSSPDNLWGRYAMRLVDASVFTGRPGVIITWMNFGHANFDSDPALAQGFMMMKIAHGIEEDNLARILQWRAAGNAGPVTVSVMGELGLTNADLYTADQIWGILFSRFTQSVPWSAHYGPFIGTHIYLPNVSPDVVWDYLRDPTHLNEWTVSLRNVREDGDGQFSAVERLEPRGAIDADWTVYPDSRSIDLRMRPIGLGRFNEADSRWMTSSLRVLDGPQTNGRPGTVLVWITYRHQVIDQSPSLAQYWQYLPLRHRLAESNLLQILVGR